MNRAQFDESMKRVLAFTNAPRTPAEIEHLQGYLNGSYEAISYMEPYLFDQVTIEICKNMSRGQRPMPGQFRAVYFRLKDEQKAKQPERICPTCKNTLWIEGTMLETKTGLEDLFAKPCPECQQRHPLKDAPSRSGWVDVETAYKPHDQAMLDRAKAMGPKGARFVLDLIDKMKGKANFHPDVVLELVKRAGDEPHQSNPQAEAVLDKLTIAPVLSADEPIDWAKESV